MRLSKLAIAAVLAKLSLGLALPPAQAQQPIQLPGIYVQGATLEAPPRARRPASTEAKQGLPADEAGPTGDDTVGGVPAYTAVSYTHLTLPTTPYV